MSQLFYIGRNKNTDIIKKSSSGGIMTAIAEWILINGGVIFGAGYVDNFSKIEHICVARINDLDMIRKSKYSWSNYIVCLLEIEKKLKTGELVLFIGTPCQCASIYNRFKNYSNLFLLDFFCRGTLEEKYYCDYIKGLNINVSKVDFRGEGVDKEKNKIFTVIDDKGKIIIKDEYTNNFLTNLFVNSAGLRRQCFSCRLCEEIHISDITMGDVHSEEMCRKYDFDMKHLSFIAINNERGKILFDNIASNLNFVQLDENDEIYIANYYRKHQNSSKLYGYNLELRNWFEKTYQTMGFAEAAYKCMYKNEIEEITKYEKIIKSRKIYLYGCGKMGIIIQKLIKKYYSFCELRGFVVTHKKMENINGLVVFEYSEINLMASDIFIIVTVVENNEIIDMLKSIGLKEGINYGCINYN